MRIGNRDLRTVFRAVTQPQHFRAFANMLLVYVKPFAMLRRYVFHTGTYPEVIGVKTPMGVVSLTAYSHHDLLTINEIFCRNDYSATASDRVVVDFGANIGISAAYFLSRSPDVRVYLFEPLPANIERLHKTLIPFAARYQLSETAVGMQDGEVTFGFEDSGRYGGIGVETGQYITVPCRDSNSVLAEILQVETKIDILKIDIEGLEDAVTARIRPEIAARIGSIYAEFPFAKNPLASTHSFRQYGSVGQLRQRYRR